MSGNGVDLGAIYQLLSTVAEAVARHDQLLSTAAETVARHGQLLSTVAEAVTRHDRALEALGRDMTEMRRDITGMSRSIKTDFAELRQTITHYHSSVVGHGILISDLEARMRRVEERLDLPLI